MSGPANTYATLYDHEQLARSVVFKASVDTKALTSTAVLSCPDPDLAGDIVVAEGMDFSRHARDPRVDIEHRRHPDFGDATVGWARTTCKSAGGYYTVRPVPLECSDGAIHPLPVATTYFDRDSALEVQVFALVEREILPAVSVEFIPDMTVAKSLGKSPLESRDAYEFARVQVVRYTLCAKGVCPSALVAKSASAEAYLSPLRSVLSAGHIGSEALHPTICKALSHYLPGKSSAVASGFAAPVVEKSDMDPYAAPVADSPAPVDTAPEEPVEEAPALGGIAAMYAKVQALLDCVTQNESDMETSDSPELRSFMEKMRGKVEAIAEEIKGRADAHDAKLNGGKKDEGEKPEDEPDDAEPDMDTDDDGSLKAVRGPYKPILKACRGRKYSLAEIKKAEEKKGEQPAPELSTPGNTPEDVERLERARRRLHKTQKIYG